MHHAMAYDSARHRTVLFGGTILGAPYRLGDTWEWDGTNWIQRALTGPTPPPRRLHTLVYDSIRKRTVLFGGELGPSAAANDTWEWDGNTWTQACSNCGPTPRLNHAAAFDAAIGAMVVYGGNDAVGVPFTQTWTWNGSTWSLIVGPPSTPAPTAPENGMMAYDSNRGVVVYFGGYQPVGNTVSSATWEFNGTIWSQRFPATVPAARNGVAMAFDSARNVTVLFGAPDDFVWEWNGTNWTSTTLAPNPGPLRGNQGMVYDAARGKLVLFGGTTGFGTTLMGDTWELKEALSFIAATGGNGAGNLTLYIPSVPTAAAAVRMLVSATPAPAGLGTGQFFGLPFADPFVTFCFGQPLTPGSIYHYPASASPYAGGPIILPVGTFSYLAGQIFDGVAIAYSAQGLVELSNFQRLVW